MTPFGKELAEKVRAQLKRGLRLAYSHRDYCGTGIEFINGKFDYGYVYDGDIMESILTFDSEEAFVSWLSGQTDESLSGADEDSRLRDNQRITKDRLEVFVAIKG